MTYSKFAVALAMGLVAQCCLADVYMHNPRGANDRNCEKNVNRNNGNRLYDTQNNAKGGYACPRAVGGPDVVTPKVYYTAGSVLPIEWTNQHGCGDNPKLNCELILQYGCTDTLDPAGKFNSGANIGTPRDGTPQNAGDSATNRIPNTQAAATPNNAGNRRFGMHETVDSYNACERRERNKGLFTADQNVRRRDARGTRQNPNGNRRGLECPEERDYYPYFHPTGWVDVAVITSKLSAGKVAYYQTNSQNTATGKKGTCVPGTAAAAAQDATRKKNRREWYNNQAACVAAGHTWTETTGHGPQNTLSAAPEVIQGQFSRVNHLGNSGGPVAGGSSLGALPQTASALAPNRYLWTIPNHVNENCVLRLRYNISTMDYDAFNPPASSTAFTGAPGVDASSNGAANSPVTQDPYVTIGNGATDFVSLAVNTNQYGRTFQDRSYVFAIRPRPNNVAAGAKIYNLNVRGKRGNIVQTYPATEYDYIPNNLQVARNDYVHVQFAGSDYNPRRGCNDGEGGPPDPNNNGGANKNARADRNNMVFTASAGANYPGDYITGVTSPFGNNKATLMRLAMLDQNADLAKRGMKCKTEAQLNAIKNKNVRERVPENCAKLNGATTPYFDGGVMQATTNGKFTYFSSRNNNFSNRDQTGYICVGNAAQCAGPEAGQGGATSPGTQLASDIIAPATEATLLVGETTADEPNENDAVGEGALNGCVGARTNSVFGQSVGLSKNAVAGVVVGAIFGGAAIAGAIAFFVMRSKSGPKRQGDQNWMAGNTA